MRRGHMATKNHAVLGNIEQRRSSAEPQPCSFRRVAMGGATVPGSSRRQLLSTHGAA